MLVSLRCVDRRRKLLVTALGALIATSCRNYYCVPAAYRRLILKRAVNPIGFFAGSRWSGTTAFVDTDSMAARISDSVVAQRLPCLRPADFRPADRFRSHPAGRPVH